MTEFEWLSATDPQPMLAFLRGRASDRKLRLFACGFCNSIDQALEDEICREAVRVAERFADGLASPEELDAACHSARLVWAASVWEGMLAAEAAEPDGWKAACGVQSALEMDDIPRNFWKQQADVLRDVFGPLLFRSVNLNRPTLMWNDNAIPKLAQSIYDDRAFDRLPILADALEEAGCTDAHILDHCRQSGEHVRGCWLVDLVLGKK
jgi:hypothetical protein